jgi:uncharacterized OB-fold protein
MARAPTPEEPMDAAPDPAPPAGWFTVGDEPRLVGTRCRACGTVFFPPEHTSCRNPACGSADLEVAHLSRRGRIWSFAINHHPAPPPALSPDPFAPYGVAAVELAEERMVVLGRVADGVDLAALRVGAEVELVVEPIVPGADELVWKWRPAP